MKPFLLQILMLTCAITLTVQAQTCREVVRDSSGRIEKTIERRTLSGGNERVVIRNASGQIIGTGI